MENAGQGFQFKHYLTYTATRFDYSGHSQVCVCVCFIKCKPLIQHCKKLHSKIRTHIYTPRLIHNMLIHTIIFV